MSILPNHRFHDVTGHHVDDGAIPDHVVCREDLRLASSTPSNLPSRSPTEPPKLIAAQLTPGTTYSGTKSSPERQYFTLLSRHAWKLHGYEAFVVVDGDFTERTRVAATWSHLEALLAQHCLEVTDRLALSKAMPDGHNAAADVEAVEAMVMKAVYLLGDELRVSSAYGPTSGELQQGQYEEFATMRFGNCAMLERFAEMEDGIKKTRSFVPEADDGVRLQGHEGFVLVFKDMSEANVKSLLSRMGGVLLTEHGVNISQAQILRRIEKDQCTHQVLLFVMQGGNLAEKPDHEFADKVTAAMEGLPGVEAMNIVQMMVAVAAGARVPCGATMGNKTADLRELYVEAKVFQAGGFRVGG